MSASEIRSDDVAVALLARPGAARERLREALVQAGASLVLEDEPAEVDAQSLLEANPVAVMIALEPAVEDALERLQPAFTTPGLTVIFDEAELVAQREGWEMQRWARHLLAKLRGSDDVLPPGREPDEDAGALPEPGLPPAPEQLHAHAPLQPHLDEAHDLSYELPGDGLYLDQAGADAGVPDEAQGIPGVPAPTPGSEAVPGLEELLAQAPAAEPRHVAEETVVAAASATATMEPSATEPPAVADAGAEPAWSRWSLVDEPLIAPAPAKPDASALADISLEGLSLVDIDAPDAGDESPVAAGDAATVDAGAGSSVAAEEAATVLPPRAPSESRSLPAPAAGVSDEDAAATRTAPVGGAVLLMAGLGGPDAVRRVLAALPSTFPRPVLVAMHLNGGQYANLVRQIARISPLPVELAVAGGQAQAGHAYVLDDATGVDCSAGTVAFVAGGDRAALLAALPPQESAVVLLSGADPARVEAVAALGEQGALVAGQGGDGCYDPGAANRLAQRGASQGEPARLAALLGERWGA
ncbi:chemotaxis protein CheB [Xanthomonas massiliensis]|uniref:chemotaxis protein CheB n=1 Tax=Xanthomonas massiliensis TaxID=1720302 RepID=UPI000AAE1B53|nr:chemotaxis protein CheB [Xanthomonas massiliensis]